MDGSFVTRDYENRNYMANNVLLVRYSVTNICLRLFSIKVELTCHGQLKDQSYATFLIVHRTVKRVLWNKASNI